MGVPLDAVVRRVHISLAREPDILHGAAAVKTRSI